MKKLISICFAFHVIAFISVQAQFIAPTEKSNNAAFNLGFGFGLDYGGFGLKGILTPAPHLGLFLGLGYNFVGLGYNLGAQYRIAPDKNVNPFLTAMYGYNGVIYVSGAPQYNGTFYGPSIGGGLEFKSKKKPKNFYSFELLVPFRSQQFTDSYNALKNNSSITFKNSPLPVAFSFGVHFGL